MPRSARDLKALVSPPKKRVTWKRTPEENTRVNGSIEYKVWLHDQPCAICDSRAWVQECHAQGDGMGRKASWTLTFPGCAACHHKQHTMGVKSFEKLHSVVLLDLAADTQRKWNAFQELK